jgi:hypothetical protein
MAGKRRAQNQQYAAEQEMEQDERLSALESQPPAAAPAAPAPAAAMSDDTISQLKELGQLHEQGVLTDEEFAQQKAKLLG